MAANWHLLECVWRSDEKVIEWLKRMHFETYYPLISELCRVPRKKLSQAQRRSGTAIFRPKMVGMFPRYVFVRFDPVEAPWRSVFDIAGVVGLHCHDDRPAPIDDALIDGLRGLEVGGAVPGKTPLRVVFKIDETVRVTEGPFASFNGIVERGIDAPIGEFDSDDRIRVAIDLFGRRVPVDLAVWQVEKV